MTNRVDTAGLIARANLPELIGGYIQLKRDGKEHKGLCPFHDDSDPSFTVYEKAGKGKYKCFACGAHGDALDFLQEYLDIDFKEAVRTLDSNALPEATHRPAPRAVDKPVATWQPILPVPEHAAAMDPAKLWNPKREDAPNYKGTALRPTAVYTYRATDGQLLGYVLRCEFEDGGKFTPQVTYCANRQTGEERWCLTFFPAPRPLYGLEELAAKPEAGVLIVEGEKCKDAAAAALTGFAVISWPGGSNGFHHVDWSRLAGRSITLWPDADDPGVAAMQGAWNDRGEYRPGIAELSGAASVRILDVTGQPKGWDVADAIKEWSAEQLLAWARERVRPWVKAAEPVRTGGIAAGSAVAPGEMPADRDCAPSDVINATVDAQAQVLQEVTRYRSPPLQEPVSDQTPVSKRDTPLPDLSDAVSFFLLWERFGLTRGGENGTGAPHANMNNVVLTLEQHQDLKGRLWFDEFLERIMTTLGSDEPREWSDSDDVRLLLWMQRAMGIHKLGISSVRDAVVAYAMQSRRNEVQDWLAALAWDGTDRLGWLMSDGFGAVNDEYTQAVGRCFMVGMVARALSPGCKVDTMPIFEGPQGKQKSTALKVLAGKWFMEASEDVLSKDFYQTMQGNLLIEIGELHAFRRADVNAVKRMISCATDRYRVSYGRHAANHPRRGVFAGTANRDDWNTDDTGARRFLPIAVGDINIDWLRANRDQLFAEAVARFNRGEPWWDVPAEAAAREQDARRDSDAWEDLISPWLESRNETTVNDVLGLVLDITPDKRDRSSQMRVASVLRVLGWEKKKEEWKNGKTVRGWRRGKGSKGSNEVQAKLLI